MNVEKEELKNILVNELGINEIDADVRASHFPELHEKLEGPMKKWLKDRTVEDVEVEGISLKEVVGDDGKRFLGTIRLFNDLLVRDLSDKDREALKGIIKEGMPFDHAFGSDKK